LKERKIMLASLRVFSIVIPLILAASGSAENSSSSPTPDPRPSALFRADGRFAQIMVTACDRIKRQYRINCND
jgi:hypothetical protein